MKDTRSDQKRNVELCSETNAGPVPGKKSRAQGTAQARTGSNSTDRAEAFAGPLADGVEARSVQAKASRLEGDATSVKAAAGRGVAGSGKALPHLARIQESFGPHDVSGVRAHVGGAAAEAAGEIGAVAYASGNDVAFAEAPTLHTAAHEAAHIVQQASGVKLAGGVGKEGDAYERHADRVADLVVAGKSAVGVLSEMSGPKAASTTAAIQRKGSGAGKGKVPKSANLVLVRSLRDKRIVGELDKGAEHGIVPGTTGETKYAELTVYEVSESRSWAHAPGTTLDELKSDLKVTNLAIPKESRAEKKLRKQAKTVRVANSFQLKGGWKVEVEVKKEWQFNTYWRVELLTEEGSIRARGTVIPEGDFEESAWLRFPVSDLHGRPSVRLTPYFDLKSHTKRKSNQ